jgi:hypothetical protein
MKTVRLLQAVETRCVFAPAEPPIPVNAAAVRGAFETCRVELEGGTISAVWKIPGGAVIGVPDATADELVGLGYATADVAVAPAS